MALLSSLTSEHEEMQQIIAAAFAFATKQGLAAIQRDDQSLRKVHHFAEAKNVLDQMVVDALGEAPLYTLTDLNNELERFAKKSPKATRAKLGNFVVTSIIRAAFWLKRTDELCWILGVEITDEATRQQLVQYHAKIVKNLAQT